MRARWIGWPLVVAAGAVAAYLRPVIRLRVEIVEVDVTAAAFVDWFRGQVSEEALVIAEDDSAVVAGFSGRAGRFSYRTTEAVRFAADAVRFEHLQGPFAECEELFTVQRTEDTTTVEHSGHFRMRYGLVGWVLGVFVVRPTFEQHVADRMLQMQRTLDEASDIRS